MLKTCMVGPRIDQTGQAHLRYSTQALKERVINKFRKQWGFYGNKSINWIIEQRIFLVGQDYICERQRY